jgi:regulatory protein
MDYLARREHSDQELVKKLLSKGFGADIVDETSQRLKAEGLQSDERFAGAYVRHRTAAGFGPLRIMAELEHRGVGSDLIQAALYHEAIDWSACLHTAWQKKYHCYADFASKAYATQCRFLSQRGFEMAEIHQLLNRRIDENQ